MNLKLHEKGFTAETAKKKDGTQLSSLQYTEYMSVFNLVC